MTKTQHNSQLHHRRPFRPSSPLSLSIVQHLEPRRSQQLISAHGSGGSTDYRCVFRNTHGMVVSLDRNSNNKQPGFPGVSSPFADADVNLRPYAIMTVH